MSDSDTVYVNDNPIGETEVYHANKHHVTTVRRWKDDYTRETTVSEAREDGLRPCAICYPGQAGKSCPGCGHEGNGADVLANGQKWCPNPACRVVSFNPPENGRYEHKTGGEGP